MGAGMRSCNTCQHTKRPEIDRRVAGGEPVAQVARDYDLNLSSLHRHKTNCLKLGSSNQIMKDAARGSAAVALLPSKENLSGAYSELRARIDQIVEQAQEQGSLKVAVSGLNSIRQTLDSLARLAGHLQPASTQVNVALQTNVNVGARQIAERLIQKFDHEPQLKAQIAQALLEVDDEHHS
jgi:carbon monoxide dehydrogenase subunit G